MIDEQSEEPRWIIDWVAENIDDEQRKWLADLEARFSEPVASQA